MKLYIAKDLSFPKAVRYAFLKAMRYAFPKAFLPLVEAAGKTCIGYIHNKGCILFKSWDILFPKFLCGQQKGYLQEDFKNNM